MFEWIRRMVAGFALTGLLGTSVCAIASEQSDLVAAAEKAFSDMYDDPDMTWFRDNLKSARGLLISPEIVKAGFVLGGSGGRAVMLVKDAATGKWAGPAFYNLATASIGFQAGVAVSQSVMLVMTDKAIDSFWCATPRPPPRPIRSKQPLPKRRIDRWHAPGHVPAARARHTFDTAEAAGR